MKECLYFHHPSHIPRIDAHLKNFNGYTDQALVDYYNQCRTKGFFGVMEQTLCMIALNITFIRRFGQSPFTITDNCLIAFGDDPISLPLT